MQRAPSQPSYKDEMRVGQKNKLTYRWARKGSRPLSIHDQRTQSTYLFGAVRPERGAGAALALPARNTEAIAAPSGRNRNESHPRRTRRSHSRSSWMARRQRPPRLPKTSRSCRCRRVRQESSTLKMAVYAGELAVEPHLQILRRNRRPGTPGTLSSISPGKSCPSLAAIGQSLITHCEDWY
jgi:hypothetical protein